MAKIRKIRTNFTLTEQARRLLEQLAEQSGLSMSSYLEQLIRSKAQNETIEDAIKRESESAQD
jgi:hypothetical protein